ncbi:hypothetical protein QQ045_017234 [Rhodiola kirilowii]
MSRRSYAKVSSRSSGRSCRGFSMRCSRRISVQAIRARFLFMFRVIKKWTYAYCRALKFLKIGMNLNDGCGDRKIGKNMSELGSSRCMNGLVADFMPRSHECSRMRSFGRSNSFYSEAIADCLEFIKRNSVSDHEDEIIVNPTVDEFENNLNTMCD